MTQDEYQQSRRTGMDPRERKKQIMALKESSDSAQAFKAGLEDRGYVVAKGDSRGFILVDEAGEIYNLSRQLRLKEAQVKEYMKTIDRDCAEGTAAARALDV